MQLGHRENKECQELIGLLAWARIMSRSIKAYYLSSITTSWSLTLLSVLSSALVLVAGSWDRLVGSATLLLVPEQS